MQELGIEQLERERKSGHEPRVADTKAGGEGVSFVRIHNSQLG